MTTYWVRPARAADFKAVSELARRVRREFHLSMRVPDRAGSAEAAELLWVVEAGRGEIVGYCGVREVGAGAWELHALYLTPEWRGFGLGRSLVEQAVRSSRQAGGLRLACTLPGDMPEAFSLLRSLGFTQEAGESSATRRFVKALGRPS
jgi:ribosomal protein S18 acetylase RimI-like enzyme